MTYNSVYFIIYLFVFLVIYFLMPKVWMKQGIILVGNIVFYRLAGGLNYLVIVIGSSVIVYVISRWIEKIYQNYDNQKEGLSDKAQRTLLESYKKRCKKILVAGLFLILGILVYIKAGKLLHWEEVTRIVDFRFGLIIVPLGISYYTFSAIGYIADIYWRKIECEHNYLKLLMCMTFFPIIVQGPISRYNALMKQFDELPKFKYERLCYGLQLMLWGYFKKIVVADRLALYTSPVLSDLNSYAGIEVALAVLFSVFFIYADFSGGIDIVRGIAQAMGVTLEQNFRQPFFSRSVAEFWRRWHITLGAWLKDYVYMPLAMSPRFLKLGTNVRRKFGKRAGKIVSYSVPLFIVQILNGLWHGTGADYLAWGCYWGILSVLSIIFSNELIKLTEMLHINTDTFGYRLFQTVRTFFLFYIGKMITITGSLDGFVLLVKRLFSNSRLWVLFDGSIYKYGLEQKDFNIALFGILVICVADIIQQKHSIREIIAGCPLVLRWFIYYVAIMLVLIVGMWGSSYNVSDFIYGNF